MESERLRECSVSKHIMAAAATAVHKQTVDGGRRQRERVKRVSVLFRLRRVCFVCALSADGGLTSAQPGYTNLSE